MEVKIIIPSSIEGSLTTLSISNVDEDEGVAELLLSIIDSTTGEESDIYVLKENLIKALNIFKEV